MGLINYFKDLHAIGREFVSESQDVKKNLDDVKIELAYAELVALDIQKDIKTYQFQVQPRIEAIQALSDKINKEIST